MDKAKKADNHANPDSYRERDYPQEAGMESRVNGGEQSFAKALTEGEDKNKILNSTNRRMPNGTYGGVRGQ